MHMELMKIIKQRGYTLQRIADEWEYVNGKKITRSTLSQSVTGNPTVKTLQGIANVIGCTVGDFFADELDGVICCPRCGKRYKLVPLDD